MTTGTEATATGVRRARRLARTERRRDRARAVAAALVVFGLGVGTTLASWTDTAVVAASVGTDEFNVQASVDNGATWSEMATAPGGALMLSAGALGLTPGDNVYSRVLLRVDPAASDYDATVSLAGATTSGGTHSLATELRYGAKIGVSAAACSAGGYAAAGTTLVGVGAVLSTGSGPTTFELEDDGTAVAVCFAIGLPLAAAATAQDDALSASWTFDIASTDPD